MRDPEYDRFGPWVIEISKSDPPVDSYESRGLRRLFFGIIGKRLLESIHLSNGTELIVIDQGQPYRYRGWPVYGADTLFVPISKIAGVAWEPDRKDQAIAKLILETNGGRFSYTFIRTNPSVSHYARVLEEVTA